MNYILDASVALCWVMRRPLTPKTLQLRDDYRLNSLGQQFPFVIPLSSL